MANNTFNIDDYLTPAPSVGNSPEQSQQFQSFNIDDYLDITDKDITGLGKKQAAEFGNQLAKFSHATPVQQYQAFEKYGQQYQNHLAQQGYSPTQIAQALTEFNANADPRNQTGLFEYYIGDRGNDVMIGTGNLIGDALAAVPESIPVLGQWADNAEKYVENTTNAWQNDLSAKNQINTYLGEKAYQDKRAEGASEFSATLSSLYENPMQVTSLLTQQVPQLLLGAAGTATLAGLDMAGAAGSSRKDIEEAYEKTFKENPEQLLKLPEIQERMAQGMTFEQAVNDAKTDISDHWKSILASALMGGTESLSPLGKFGQGVNRGVLKTLGKEMGQEALQEGAEQLNSNLAVGEIDGKTGVFDEVVRNATLGAVAGLGTGIPTAIEAGLNGRTESDADIDKILNRSAESAKNANAKAQGEFQRANSTNTQSTSEQSSVDEQILESVVSGVADEELRNQYFDELKSSIQDGSIVQEAEQNTAFGRFAKAYMDQAQAKAGVEPQTSQTETITPDLETDSTVENPIAPESVNRIDETQLQQYEQELNQLISEVQAGQITPNAITARYADIADRYPNHNELVAELSSRKQRVQEIENDPTLDAETKAEQTLYSHSPMKSVEANIKRGQERMTQAILDKADVKRGMYNQEFGWVDFVWGDDGVTKEPNANGEPRGRGIAHIFEARERKDGQDYQQTSRMLVNDIVNTIAKGSIVTRTPYRMVLEYKENPNDLGHKAILTKDRSHNSNSWLLTGFENDPNKGRKANSNGERTVGYGTSTPTQNTPMRSRDNLGALEMHQQAGYGLNVHQSTQQRNRQIAQDQQTLSRILGEETASHIQVVDRNTKVPSGRDVKQLATKGVEGWFEPSTQKLYIISDNITANDVLSRDERLAWVAFHELAHAGVRIKYGHLLTNVLASASQNVVVKVLARKIQAEHGYEREIAIEEAMMEIYAAYETGNWVELESRYKTKIHESYKQGKNSVGDFLTRVANALRRLIGGIIGKDLTQTMTTSQVFDTLRGIQQGINDIAKSEQNQTASENGNIRYSFAGEKAQTANHSLLEQAKRAVAQGQDPETVRQETGWFTGVDGKWRFEIDDSQVQLKPEFAEGEIGFAIDPDFEGKSINLEDLIDAPELFSAYPDLRTLKVDTKTTGGSFYLPSKDTISLAGSRVGKDARSSLLHEIQHAIQERENFARGANPGNFSDTTEAKLSTRPLFELLRETDLETREVYHKFGNAEIALENNPDNPKIREAYEQAQNELLSRPNGERLLEARWLVNNDQTEVSAYEQYMRTAGEVEARNVQSRMDMNNNERRAIPPEETEDRHRYKQTVSFRDNLNYELNENDNSEFAKAVPKRQANSFDQVKTLAKSFLNKPLHNNETGIEAIISRANLDKMLSGKAHAKSTSLHDHLLAVANVDMLFENAIHGWTEPYNKNSSDDVVGVHKMFAPLNIDGNVKLVKLTVKELKPEQGNRVYSVETIEIGNEKAPVPEMAELGFETNSHRLHEGNGDNANVQSLIQRIKDFNSSNENSDNIRYSVKQSAMEQAKSGKSIPRETLLDQALSLDMETYKTLFQKGKSKVAEQLADSKMPVIDFINQWKNVKAADKQRIIQALQRAEITRDTERGKLEQVYTKPILEGLVEFTKDSKLDLFTIKRLVGFWISARWSIEKNQMLLEQDRKAMDEAKQIYDSALANSQDSEVIDRADLDYRRAKRQYENRKHDVELDLGSDYSNKAFKVGTAGGWSIPEAKLLMQYIEQRLPVDKMKVLAEKVYDLNQALLKLDNESGRYTDEQLAEYSSHRHYVPLTGDNGDSDIDFIGGVAQKAFNIGKDKRLLGRKNSEAEDAFDAVWKSLGKTTQYYGWAVL